MVNKWTLYIDGAKQLRTAIDAADVSCYTDVNELATVPLQILELILTDKMVCLIICACKAAAMVFVCPFLSSMPVLTDASRVGLGHVEISYLLSTDQSSKLNNTMR